MVYELALSYLLYRSLCISLPTCPSQFSELGLDSAFKNSNLLSIHALSFFFSPSGIRVLKKMKLLGWMHRKFRQNSSDVFGGGTCNCLAGRPSLDEPPMNHDFDAFLGYSAAAFPTPPNNSDISYVTPDLFPSSTLLSIGTLGFFPSSIEDEQHDFATGTDTLTLGPLESLQTPEQEESDEKIDPEEETEVAAMVEAIAEKAAEATTESDLMVVTAELEKALAAVAAAEEKDGNENRVSSARPSSGISECPLQGFLFRSPMVDLTAKESEETAREKRASLGELFMRSRMAELSEETGEEPEGGEEKGEERWTARIGLKKIIGLRSGSRGSGATVDTNNKLQKIIQMFHRKVYPENAITRKNKWSSTRIKKREMSKDHLQSLPKKKSEEMESCIANRDISRDTTRKVCAPSFNCCSARSFVQFDDGGSTDSGVNREHWIKTDADYLVLEL